MATQPLLFNSQSVRVLWLGAATPNLISQGRKIIHITIKVYGLVFEVHLSASSFQVATKQPSYARGKAKESIGPIVILQGHNHVLIVFQTFVGTSTSHPCKKTSETNALLL